MFFKKMLREKKPEKSSRWLFEKNFRNASFATSFAAVLFILLQSSLSFAQTTQETPNFITVKNYCSLLQAVGTSDLHSLFENATQIVRSGDVGNYRYEVIVEKEKEPMTFLSINDVTAYCAWKNSQLPSSSSHLPYSCDAGAAIEAANIDPLLKSNQMTFHLLEPSLATVGAVVAADTSWMSEILDGILEGTAFAALFEGAGAFRGEENRIATEERLPEPSAPSVKALIEPSAPQELPGTPSTFFNIFQNTLAQNPNARRFILTTGNGSHAFFVHAVEENPEELSKNRDENVAINKFLQVMLSIEFPLINSEDLFDGDPTTPLSAERLRHIGDHFRAAASRSSSSFSVYDQEGNRFARVVEESENKIEPLTAALRKNLEKKGILYSDKIAVQERDELADAWAAAFKEELQARETLIGSATVSKAQTAFLKKEMRPLWDATIATTERAKARCEEALGLISKTMELANNTAAKERRAIELQETEKEKADLSAEENWRREMWQETRTLTRLATTRAAFEELKKRAQEFTTATENFYLQINTAPFEEKQSLHQQASPTTGKAEYYWGLTRDMLRQGLELAKKEKSFWQTELAAADRQLHKIEAFVYLTKTEAFMGLAQTEPTPFHQSEMMNALRTTLDFLKNKNAELRAGDVDRTWWDDKIKNTQNSAINFYKGPAEALWKAVESASQDAGMIINQAQTAPLVEQEALYSSALEKIESATKSLEKFLPVFERTCSDLKTLFPIRRREIQQEHQNKVTASTQASKRLAVTKLFVEAEKSASIAALAERNDLTTAVALDQAALQASIKALRGLYEIRDSNSLSPELASWWDAQIKSTEERIDQFYKKPLEVLWKAAESATEAACAAKKEIGDAPFDEKSVRYDQALKKIDQAIDHWKTAVDPLLKKNAESVSTAMPRRADLIREWREKSEASQRIQQGLTSLKLLTEAERTTAVYNRGEDKLWNDYRIHISDMDRNLSSQNSTELLVKSLLMSASDVANKRSRAAQLHLQISSPGASDAFMGAERFYHEMLISHRDAGNPLASFNGEVLKQALEKNHHAQERLDYFLVHCDRELEIENQSMLNPDLKNWWISMRQSTEQKQIQIQQQAAMIKRICTFEVQKKENDVIKLNKELNTFVWETRNKGIRAGWEKYGDNVAWDGDKVVAFQIATKAWKEALQQMIIFGDAQNNRTTVEAYQPALKKAEEQIAQSTYIASLTKFVKLKELANRSQKKAIESNTIFDWEDYIQKAQDLRSATEEHEHAAMASETLYKDLYNFVIDATHAVINSTHDASWGEYRKCNSIALEARKKADESGTASDWEDFIMKAQLAKTAAEMWKKNIHLVCNAIDAMSSYERKVTLLRQAYDALKYWTDQLQEAEQKSLESLANRTQEESSIKQEVKNILDALIQKIEATIESTPEDLFLIPFLKNK